MSGDLELSVPIQTEMRRLASAIAFELRADLMIGKISKIGVKEIRTLINKIIPSLATDVSKLLEKQVKHKL